MKGKCLLKRTISSYRGLLTFILLITYLFYPITSEAAKVSVKTLKLPKGFHITIFSSQVPDARQMALGDKGTVFVGTWRDDKVYALVDSDHDGRADKRYVIAKNLNHPNGVAFHQGALYVAEIDKIIKYPNIEQRLAKPPKPIMVKNRLPNKRHHGARYIKFGPDGWLYMGIGMPCNICLVKNPWFGTIVRLQANGDAMQIFARGVRNSVGFAWSPKTNRLWFTDNGRDWLGDHLPPDEVNYVPDIGLNFGFPYVYGNNIPDPKYIHYPRPNTLQIPAYNLPAHVAALGMIFYHGKQFPKAYQQRILIAEHGSWNSSKRVGYQVTQLILKNNKVIASKPFITGWLVNGWNIVGRPVDLLQLKDGSLLISDDYTGAIYRVTYSKVNSSKSVTS